MRVSRFGPWLIGMTVAAWGCSSENPSNDGKVPAVAGQSATSAGSGTGAVPSAGSNGGGASGSSAGVSGNASGGNGGSGGSSAGTSSGGALSGNGGSASAGKGGTGGTVDPGDAGSGTGGEPGPGSDPQPAGCNPVWPKPTETIEVEETIEVSGKLDGKGRRYVGAGELGSDGQEEGQPPLFVLADGAQLVNVVLGSPAADGVHCKGSCTLENVWWEDVGEDAATFKGTSASQVMRIVGGGARAANDKVFQHNGPGTMLIQGFYAEDFGKLYRSCGNCSTQHERHVEVSGVAVKSGGVLVGVNVNYGDTAKLSGITLCAGSPTPGICDRFTGNDEGDEPKKLGSGPDGTSCIYTK